MKNRVVWSLNVVALLVSIAVAQAQPASRANLNAVWTQACERSLMDKIR